MQDLKNNTDPANRADAQPTDRLDQDFRRLLMEAELTPDAKILDQIMDDLQGEQPAKVLGSDPATRLKVETPAPPVRKVGVLRKNLSFAAAVAGILVVLAIGLKELTRTDSVVMVPTVNSGLAGAQPANGAAAVTTDSGNSIAKGRKAKEIGTVAAALKESGKVARTTAKVEPVKTTHKERIAVKPSEALNGSHDLVATATGSDPASLSNRPAGAVPNIPKSGSVQTGHRTPVATATAVITDKTKAPVSVKDIARTPLDPASRNSAPATALAGQPATSAGLGLNPPLMVEAQNQGHEHEREREHQDNALALNTEKDPGSDSDSDLGRGRRTGKRRTRGLLKGLVSKLTTTAQTISEEVVSQDEDKTVINFGVIAITTYR